MDDGVRVLDLGPLRVYVHERPAEIELSRALAEVSSVRREQALRYRNEIDRQLSVAVYLLLKRGLRESFGLEGNPVLAVGPQGKPYLPQHPEIHFNFSHCRTAAACAVGKMPVGVDIETIAPFDREVAKRVLSPDELRSVDAAECPEVAFARFWTRKEALVKLRGEALDDTRLPGLLETAADGVRLETLVATECVLSVGFLL